ncbi:phosphatase PAP2 family protein [Lichenihabitans sp. Uapishka_5]|uniref:phosphatase PAP2 family protein n=1 Tax=Lichenihabitans sp. Uapishka_5 TaxID=3037302 RepID=UPI0029E8047F|nr:phosphatase PAP2 family protein [Lichenihabitans sp. Uapishka_5]MDX7950964.1 phosphatase PAP2 family protein [Lichenihabitans sp. Uapishka_5]
MAPLEYVTDFADQAVMLPLALVVGIAMLAAGWRRGAFAWAVAIGGMLGVMLVLKLWAGTCGVLVFGDQMQSPSGHTASAAAIYGGVLALLLRRAWPGVPLAVPCAAALAVLIGTTRVLLGAHSVPEVVVGGIVGIVAATVLVRLAGPVPPNLKLRALPSAAAILGILLVFHGLHMPAEAAIRKVRITWLPFGLCRGS